jgi:aspartate aminotransferase-like enzyme
MPTWRLTAASGWSKSATVTAVTVPDAVTWTEFDRRLRRHGLAAGGSYGPIAGKVFRLGHMGTQADMGLVRQALDVLEREIKSIRKQGDRK